MSERLLPPTDEGFLELLGYGHLRGQPTGREIDGKPVLAEDFIKLCDAHARPALTAFQRMSPDHEDYDEYKDALRAVFRRYFETGE